MISEYSETRSKPRMNKNIHTSGTLHCASGNIHRSVNRWPRSAVPRPELKYTHTWMSHRAEDRLPCMKWSLCVPITSLYMNCQPFQIFKGRVRSIILLPCPV